MDRYFYSNAITQVTQVYECGAVDYASLPNEDVDVFVFGKSFNAIQDQNTLINIVKRFLWLTYRKNLQPICDIVNLTCDQGWGCMHRSGQMLLSNLLLRILFHNELPFAETRDGENIENAVLNLFIDNPDAPLSLHSITAEASTLLDKKPGEWLGPNAVCQVLKQLFEANERPLVPELTMHVCRDGILIIEEVLSLFNDNCRNNQKLYLMIPLRLGLTELNPQYFSSLVEVMQMHQFAGLVGGKPNHASWFFGCFGNKELLCLDPHTTQPFIDPAITNDNSSYHCSYITRIPIGNLDPSLALTFLCDGNDSFTELCSKLNNLFKKNSAAALFDVVQDMPPAISSSMADWPVSSSEDSSDGATVGDDFEVIN